MATAWSFAIPKLKRIINLHLLNYVACSHSPFSSLRAIFVKGSKS